MRYRRILPFPFARGLSLLVAISLVASSLLFLGCNANSSGSEATSSPTLGTPREASEVEVEVVATNLQVPWALAFAPDGRLFFTERGGQIRVVEDGVLARDPLATVDVAAIGEAGLLGLALDPDFSRNHYLYVYHTYRTQTFTVRNRVIRLTEKDGKASKPVVILDDIPGGTIHDGGRIDFGPDGKLYVTTGDAANSELAQDRRSLAGKILRLNADGSIPDDNPFEGSPIYTLGHRNPQGLAWHPITGELYATEHGPVGNDEVNIIEKGANYGWPVVQGMAHRDEYRDPIVLFNPTMAPSGATFYANPRGPWDNDLFIGGLLGRQLIRITLVTPQFREVRGMDSFLKNEFGRLRDVIQGPDGYLYISTSNRDGRGAPTPDDDRIIRLRPKPAS